MRNFKNLLCYLEPGYNFEIDKLNDKVGKKKEVSWFLKIFFFFFFFFNRQASALFLVQLAPFLAVWSIVCAGISYKKLPQYWD